MSAPAATVIPAGARLLGIACLAGALVGRGPLNAAGSPVSSPSLAPELPDPGLVVAYERAARSNVLAALNPKVFPGYWSVCADGQGFGYGNTYPSLDGHQMTDALLWLGQIEAVRSNWAYVLRFQRPDGLLPIAILPGNAGQAIGAGEAKSMVATNGALYQHWVPGNPLGALASPTVIQNADVIFRHTQDRTWLAAQLPALDRAADYLASITTPDGAVKGAGYYVERPTRLDTDGVAQGHAFDALRRLAALHRAVEVDLEAARRYDALADRIQRHFTTRFWLGDRFAEYEHPQRGLISHHGLTDTDWAALATGIATAEQGERLWPQLRREERFHYGGMPTGIAMRPEAYEDWEFTHPDRLDLAAMGRVWYLEAWARARQNDADGLLAGLHKVAEVGREYDYAWRERYHPDPTGKLVPAGTARYCEYPANLIRIVQEFLLGVDLRLDGSVALTPTVPESYWVRGFGQNLIWADRHLDYRMQAGLVRGKYTGRTPLKLGVRLVPGPPAREPRAEADGRPLTVRSEGGLAWVELPGHGEAPPRAVEFAIRNEHVHRVGVLTLPRIHDPSTLLRAGDTYWLFSTGVGVSSWHSRDLRSWEAGPPVFAAKPAWVQDVVPNQRGHFWAPEVIRLDDRYLLYYSVSAWGRNESAIALATARPLAPDHPEFAWTDEGIVVRSHATNDFNAIDPTVLRARDGRLWLAFGSFWSGIRLAELDPSTGRPKEPDREPLAIAGGPDLEAAALVQHDDDYFLFVNRGLCCRGTNSTYEIRLGRSRAATGPYRDRSGQDLLQGGGSPFLASEGRVIGPGHAGVTRDGTNDWFSFHFYDRDRDGAATLGIRRLTWDSDGWPVLGETITP